MAIFRTIAIDPANPAVSAVLATFESLPQMLASRAVRTSITAVQFPARNDRFILLWLVLSCYVLQGMFVPRLKVLSSKIYRKIICFNFLNREIKLTSSFKRQLYSLIADGPICEPSRQCPENQEWSECHTRCEPSCIDRNPVGCADLYKDENFLLVLTKFSIWNYCERNLSFNRSILKSESHHVSSISINIDFFKNNFILGYRKNGITRA